MSSHQTSRNPIRPDGDMIRPGEEPLPDHKKRKNDQKFSLPTSANETLQNEYRPRPGEELTTEYKKRVFDQLVKEFEHTAFIEDKNSNFSVSQQASGASRLENEYRLRPGEKSSPEYKSRVFDQLVKEFDHTAFIEDQNTSGPLSPQSFYNDTLKNEYRPRPGEEPSTDYKKFLIDQNAKDFEHAAFCEEKSCSHPFCCTGKKTFHYIRSCECRCTCIICLGFAAACVTHARRCELAICKFPGCAHLKQKVFSKQLPKFKN